MGFDDFQKQALKNFLKPYKNELSEISQKRFNSNPLRILDSKSKKDLEIIKKAPSISSYLNKADKLNFKVIQGLLEDLEIPFIDLNEELFQKHKDPLSLYPFRLYGHFNELGYKTVSEIIFKKFFED